MKRSLLISVGLILLLIVFVAAADSNKDKTTSTPTMRQAVSQMTGMAATGEHVFVSEKDLHWTEAPNSLPHGAEIAMLEGDMTRPGLFTARLRMPDSYRVPPHFHPADEHVTVLKGALRMGMGDSFDEKNMKELTVGDFAVMPKGQHHYAQASGETIIQLHGEGPWGITYVNAKDDPRRAHAGKD